MSGAAIGWAKAQTAPDGASKAVLIALADYANHKGEAWPAIRELARELQKSERSVQRALAKLVECGLLTRASQFRPNGSQTTDRYTFRIGEKATSPVTECHPPGDTSVTPGVTPMSPLEPPLEPEGTDVPSTRERASDDVEEGLAVEPPVEPTSDFRTAFGLWCEAAGGRAASFEPESWEVWRELTAGAVEGAVLLGCVRAFLADPTLKRRSYGVGGLQGWLRKGGWRSYVGVVVEAAETSAAVPGGRFVGPAEVRALVVDGLGENVAHTIIDPASWSDDGRRVTPRTGWAFEQMRALDWGRVGAVLVDPRSGR